MANRLPPSQRPERRQPDRTPTHDELNQLVLDAEAALAYGWGQRGERDRILLLCDSRREEAHNLCVECWGGRPLDHARLRSGDYLVGVHPLSFLDLLSQSSANLRAASQELRAFSRLPFEVAPLFVITEGGHWATQWSPKDSPLTIIRYNPCDGRPKFN